jgi:hypothetical protein
MQTFRSAFRPFPVESSRLQAAAKVSPAKQFAEKLANGRLVGLKAASRRRK